LTIDGRGETARNSRRERQSTSSGAVRSPPAKGRPSISPALYASTRSSRHPLRHARSPSVSRSSHAPGPHGIPIRSVRPWSWRPAAAWYRAGAVRSRRFGRATWSGPPGEKHWHGATADTAMTHFAIVEQLDGKSVDWMEKVSDEQYQAPRWAL